MIQFNSFNLNLNLCYTNPSVTTLTSKHFVMKPRQKNCKHSADTTMSDRGVAKAKNFSSLTASLLEVSLFIGNQSFILFSGQLLN